MKKYLSRSMYAAVAGAAMLLSFAAIPAEAQPGGSYLQTCRNVRGHGDTMSAVCRRADGSWARTTMRDVDRCRGGVANVNGRLACNHGRHMGSSGPAHRQRDRGWGEGYGSSYGPGRYDRGNYWHGR
jgi:hypothetical protein